MVTYNGWNNYETWLVHLWLTNDEAVYHQLRHKSANDIRSYVWDNKPELQAGMYEDMINGSLGVVDWREIAQALSE